MPRPLPKRPTFLCRPGRDLTAERFGKAVALGPAGPGKSDPPDTGQQPFYPSNVRLQLDRLRPKVRALHRIPHRLPPAIVRKSFQNKQLRDSRRISPIRFDKLRYRQNQTLWYNTSGNCDGLIPKVSSLCQSRFKPIRSR